jgi:hypothetical protein
LLLLPAEKTVLLELLLVGCLPFFIKFHLTLLVLLVLKMLLLGAGLLPLLVR